MSHPLCYNLLMKMKNDELNEGEILVRGFLQEDDEIYFGCDTITAPDGNEYPIKDRD